MKTQKYTRAALLRLASKYCFLSGSRGNYRIRTWDDARGCYRETPGSNYAVVVGWVRATPRLPETLAAQGVRVFDKSRQA